MERWKVVGTKPPGEVAMVLGLASGRVSLARTHDAWSAAYERERARIAAAIGEHVLGIEHVGSTSIPDVPAKPILDILVGVEDFDRARVCVEPMAAIGYDYRGENGIPRRHYFVKGEPRTHHLHMVEVGSDAWSTTLRFRDLLRTHSDLASEYAHEKERLAALYRDDRGAYQREKDEVVERILGR
jgi:GrpB-like predicted nucleotidyltransferase (UPF0157 family)